jgi:hypothetical protein
MKLPIPRFTSLDATSVRRLFNVLLGTGALAFSSGACAQQSGSQRGSAVQQGFQHAVARRGCTQEDAPALELILTRTLYDGVGDPAPSYIRVEISSPPGERIGASRFELIQLRRDPSNAKRIVRAELVEASRPAVWMSGTVSLTEAVPGERVSGRYTLTAPGGQRFDSTFTAAYSAKAVTCG